MDLLTPDFGLVFWQIISFVVVFLILAKYAWKPILDIIDKREKLINDAVKSATEINDKMAKINEEREKIILQANFEKNQILQETVESRKKILFQAEQDAKNITQKMINDAKKDIEMERNKAISDIKKEVMNMSIDIAETLMKEQLDSKIKQETFLNSLFEKTGALKKTV